MMDKLVFDRFCKIANMMMDDNQSVRLQALERCNAILLEHRLHWVDIISMVGRGPVLPDMNNAFEGMFSDLKRRHGFGPDQQAAKPQTTKTSGETRASAKPAEPAKASAPVTHRVSGDDIPRYVTGFIEVIDRYDGASRGRKSFVDINLHERDGDEWIYGMIRIFDETSMSSIADIASGQTSESEYDLEVRKGKSPYPPTAVIVG